MSASEVKTAVSIYRLPVEGSSAIVSAGYDPVSKTAEVEWKGGRVYRATGVEAEDWKPIHASMGDVEESTGKLINALKGKYQFEAVKEGA